MVSIVTALLLSIAWRGTPATDPMQVRDSSSSSSSSKEDSDACDLLFPNPSLDEEPMSADEAEIDGLEETILSHLGL